MVEAIALYAARLMARREASRLPTAGWAPPPTGHCADGRDSGPWTSEPIRLEASCRPTTHICCREGEELRTGDGMGHRELRPQNGSRWRAHLHHGGCLYQGE